MSCLFCKIIAGTIPAKKVFENEQVLAFYDIMPQAPVHVLIIPKQHIPTMNEVEQQDFTLISEIHRVAQHVARKLHIAHTGYRLINNCGLASGQVVFHIHYHLLGGKPLGALIASDGKTQSQIKEKKHL